jgi:phenylpyruvate tautomerase
MPLLKLEVTAAIPEPKRSTLLKQLSRLVANGVGKPEEYVMVTVNQTDILMAGQAGNAAFIDLRSIGGISADINRKLTEDLCDLLETQLQIPPDRVYVAFTNVQATDWGWNGSTFG